ncbi:glycine cleavage system aminomethyltransferase GcvT [Salinispira pacifica]|uniref:aminomethyltransferase n=1 Tax=Salinispira pacifica TaxID=1307761 RepID=V5WE71_9SPIO|nr:glycine cleavage system aminomethyltransferase GcvT [Salinispira pacifica]AHC13456.1 Aminomethyltransferase, glycine cleavage system T protein [Salinispira pacifica]
MKQKTTVLHSWHKAHGGKMVDFAGYEMPVQYAAGSRQEHLAVRRSAGLFDISHMGRLYVRCRDNEDIKAYERLISSHVSSMETSTGSYGLLCRHDGGILDDIFHFRLEEDSWLLVVNAANHQKDLDWIRTEAPELQVEDITGKIGMLALQGPESLKILSRAGYEEKVKSIPQRNQVSRGNLFEDGIFTRTGYTGEDGVEIYAPTEKIEQIADALLQAAEKEKIECPPCGLAARDSLRFEPGYPLYGHELTEEITPREATMKWTCKLDDGDPDFIGKEAIRQRYAENDDFHRLRTVKMLDRGMPRQDMKVVDAQGNDIGWVASGIASPSLDGFYANIFIRKSASQTGNRVYIEIRGSRKEAEIVKRPLYRVL